MSVRDELERIYNADGTLTPRAVVDDARPDDATLHPCFEWDDSIAGEQYRLDQARHLIRSVKVTVAPARKTKALTVRAFHNVAAPDEPRRYVPLRVLMDDPDTADTVLARARDEWRHLRRKYSDLEGFLEMVRGDLAA
jgi:hypothetical protein